MCRGVLPWGWNHLSSEGRFVIVAPSMDEFDDVACEFRERVARPFQGIMTMPSGERCFKESAVIVASTLRRGDGIGIVAPSNVVSGDRLLLIENGAQEIAAMGFVPVVGNTLRLSDEHGIAAGSPQERADEINRLFADDSIRMI